MSWRDAPQRLMHWILRDMKDGISCLAKSFISLTKTFLMLVLGAIANVQVSPVCCIIASAQTQPSICPDPTWTDLWPFSS